MFKLTNEKTGQEIKLSEETLKRMISYIEKQQEYMKPQVGEEEAADTIKEAIESLLY